MDRSVVFYARLGFEMRHDAASDGRRIWAFLERGDARLMVAEADGAFDPRAQGIIFYLYTRDPAPLRARLVAGGVDAGDITTGGPGPDRELELTDPDGYVLMFRDI